MPRPQEGILLLPWSGPPASATASPVKAMAAPATGVYVDCDEETSAWPGVTLALAAMVEVGDLVDALDIGDSSPAQLVDNEEADDAGEKALKATSASAAAGDA